MRNMSLSRGSAGSDSSFESVQGQRYDASGAAVGGEFQVNTFTTNLQYAPSVSVDADGDFVVVWQTSGSAVQSQRYDASGVAIGGEFHVNRGRAASVSVDADGDFVVVWQQSYSAGSDSSGDSIHGQRYDASGAAVGLEFQVNTYTTNHQRSPSVSVDADDEFVVVWTSLGSAGSDSSSFSVQGRRYTEPPDRCPGPVVVPNALTLFEGNANGRLPFGSNQSTRRYQQVFAASEFPCPAVPRRLTGLRLRPTETLEGTPSWIIEVDIRLSTTSKAPDGLSTAYVVNVGADETVVYGPASLTLSTTNTGAPPKDFDFVIPFQRDFLYDPTAGNLLLDVRILQFDLQVSNLFDAEASGTDGVSNVQGFHPTIGAASTLGLVVQFTVDPGVVPALRPTGTAALVALLLAAGALLLRGRLRLPS